MQRLVEVLAAVVMAGAWWAAAAQGTVNGPQAPIVIVVGSPPGTPGDAVARAISGALAVALRRPAVVGDRPGAIGTIALAGVVRAPADGATFGLLGMQSVVAPNLLPPLPYELMRDLVPLRQLTSVSNVLVVRGDGPYTTLDELIAAARNERLSYGTGGNGTPSHLAAELFRQSLQLELQQVPSKGAVKGVTAVMGGHVPMMFATAPAVVGLVKAGRLRALAVSSPARIPALAGVPTLAELGHAGVALRDWQGLVAAAGTQPEVLAKMLSALDAVLAMPAVREQLAAAGLDVIAESGPRPSEALLRSVAPRWAGVVKRGGIRAQ